MQKSLQCGYKDSAAYTPNPETRRGDPHPKHSNKPKLQTPNLKPYTPNPKPLSPVPSLKTSEIDALRGHPEALAL